jgi:hypothetical protein
VVVVSVYLVSNFTSSENSGFTRYGTSFQTTEDVWDLWICLLRAE